MKQIFLNADDFGASREINEGIKQAISSGRMQSVSLMVTMPYFTDAVLFLKQHPEIKIGLHFNLTEKEFTHIKVKNFLADLFFHPSSFNLIKQELLSQYRILEKTGLTISHLDSHQHIHLWPPLFKLMYDFAQKQHIPRLRAHSISFQQLALMWKIKPTFKQCVIMSFYWVNWLLFIPKKESTPTITNLIFDLNWQENYSPLFIKNFFKMLPTGNTELICHLSSSITDNPFSRDRKKCLSFVRSKGFGRILLLHQTVHRDV